jgi:hypothetical protein
LLFTIGAAFAFAVAAAASGCGSAYRADTTDAGDAASDVATNADATDGASDASACGADLLSDPKNCGRCGHDCLGGTCDSGRCGPVLLANTGAKLWRVVVSGAYVYVSSIVQTLREPGGLWRVPLTGGPAELYVSFRRAEGMAVLGDTLYFVVDDPAANGADAAGGLYSCPTTGPAPCMPTLIVAAEQPRAVSADQSRVFYTDKTSGKGLMVYVPPGPPVQFRDVNYVSIGSANNLVVDGADSFYSVGGIAGLDRTASLLQVLPDGGMADLYLYRTRSGADGRLFVTPDAMFYTAYDFDANSTAGVVRRIPRTSGAPCDVGGATSTRPFGVYADATRVYWTNQGEGQAVPYKNGRIASCGLTGCCASPELVWTTPEQPTDITGDSSALYFVTQSGLVLKLAKP